MKTKLQITLPAERMERLQAMAKELCIAPSVLVRMWVCQVGNLGVENNSYIVSVKNKNEIEEYAEARGMDAKKLFEKAVEFYMARYRITDLQKSRVKGNVEK